ncbi:MAG: alanine:cation symporter family protein, partial [Sandaracinaceae bacterium]
MLRRALPFVLTLAIVASPAAAQTDPEPESKPLVERIDEGFGKYVVGPLAAVLFFDVVFWDNDDPAYADTNIAIRWLAQGSLAGGDHRHTSVPIVVLWLVLGALFFTLRFGFINLRGFWHAVMITSGKYDRHDHKGEVSHFQALSSALSATVGLGNIAGVAIAVSTGGPGAVFWMIVAGFLGMSSKFTECTLGMMYRTIDADGRVLGGPMRYLSDGLAEIKRGTLGKVLAGVFAVMCIGGSFGGGNLFQANQAFAQTARVVPWLADKSWLFGIVVAALVGLVILGG